MTRFPLAQALRQYLARRRLQRIVEKARASYECQSFIRHRQAALKGIRKERG